MEIWNHHLVRVTGLTFDLLDDLCLHRSIDIVKEALTIESEISSMSKPLSDDLFELVKRAGEDRELSRKSLNLRRDVFNERKIRTADVESVSRLLTDETIKQLNGLASRHCRLAEIKNELDKTIRKERHVIRQSLKKCLSTETFQSGLLLGSSTLYDSLSDYLRSQPQEERKWEGEEIGFVRYLTRAIAKTSPFSTFTSLGVLTHGSNTSQGRIRPIKKTLIRLNNRILRAYLDLLWRHYPFYRHLKLRLNNTIYNDPNKYTFILNTSNNNEAFQEIPKQPILEFIVSTLTRRGRLSYDGLLKELTRVVSAPREELADFVSSLLNYGFLEYEPEVTSMDPDWCKSLIEVLKKRIKKNDDASLRKLIDSLTTIQQKYVRYEFESSIGRAKLLNAILEIIYESYCDLHKAVGLPQEQRTAMDQYRSNSKISADDPVSAVPREKDSGKQKILQTSLFVDRRAILYEDTSSSEKLDINRLGIERTVKTLNDFNRELHFANIYEDSREKIRQFFLNKYGPDATVPCLTFYREFSENKVDKKIDAYPTEGRSLKEKWMTCFSEQIHNRQFLQDTLYLSLDEIIKVNQQLGIRTDNAVKRSYSAFFQTSYDRQTGNYLSVINAVLFGYGKFASRFLPLFNKGLTTYFRNKNRDLMGDCIFVEHNDASYFNANMHPPLLDKELITTGNHPVMKQNDFIKIQDVDVCYSEAGHEVYLKDKTTGNKIVVFDLGFQAVSTRSSFFNFMASFTQSSVPDYGIIVSCLYEAYEKYILEGREWSDEFMVYPRVCVDNNVVLTRKRWRIHPNRFPVFSKADDFGSKLRSIWSWKAKFNMPEEFFIAFAPGILNGAHLTKNDEKPQYINLSNPFLITVFIKMLSRGTTLSIEEMLPESRCLETTPDNRRFVSEVLVHWNS